MESLMNRNEHDKSIGLVIVMQSDDDVKLIRELFSVSKVEAESKGMSTSTRDAIAEISARMILIDYSSPDGRMAPQAVYEGAKRQIEETKALTVEGKTRILEQLERKRNNSPKDPFGNLSETDEDRKGQLDVAITLLERLLELAKISDMPAEKIKAMETKLTLIKDVRSAIE